MIRNLMREVTIFNGYATKTNFYHTYKNANST
jgi:hypothetical protein